MRRRKDLVAIFTQSFVSDHYIKPESEPVVSEGARHEAVASKYPMLRRRRRLIVIALDCYDSNGFPEMKMIQIVQDIIKAVRSDSLFARVTGLALSTAMSLTETTEFLTSAKIHANEFDALICNSGGEVYYPGTCTQVDGKLVRDPDYAAHIDYRWGCDGLKKTIWKLMNTTEGGKQSDESSNPIEEDKKSRNAHCIAYLVKDRSKVKRVDDLRQKLRMRGLRCHLMYCRNSTRLQIIPHLASRAQALRYLFVRWRLNVANMFVILGENGDTDYEEMISGAHKTIILKDVVTKGSEDLLRATDLRDDIVPKESPLIAYLSGKATASEIADVLKQVSKASAGM